MNQEVKERFKQGANMNRLKAYLKWRAEMEKKHGAIWYAPSRALILLVLAGSMFLGACSKDADEPRKEPGSFLRPGGDVVIGRAQ